MKQITQEALAKLQAIQNQNQSLQVQMQHNEMATHTIILSEKVRLVVPPEWAYDGEHNVFIPPDQIPAGKKVVEVGPASLPILVPENAQVVRR
uniref:Uncharacterized protein n=1 Tax=viral metagenome TaxID=1070528 RepID=A0A6M3LAF1_9ZZZZ